MTMQKQGRVTVDGHSYNVSGAVCNGGGCALECPPCIV